MSTQPYVRIENEKHMRIFNELLNTDDAESAALRDAYEKACCLRGRWAVAPPVVNRMQLFRALVGLPWKPETPQMAVRQHLTLPYVDLAFAKFVTSRATPTWREIVAGLLSIRRAH